MRFKALGILFLSIFMIAFLFGQNVAEGTTDAGSPNAEPDGREGFGVFIGNTEPTDESADVTGSSNEEETNKDSDANTEDNDKSENDTEEDEKVEASKDESSDEKETKAVLTGVIDLTADTYLNIRTGPWATIIGNLHKDDKVEILSKEGDWFKIQLDGKTAFVHSYYVDAPGFPSHQGVEPPSGLGSNQKPGDTQTASSIAQSNGEWADPCTPMPSSVSSNYGPRNISVGSSFHEGLDFPVSNGTRLNALSDGVVTSTGWSSGGGRYLNIKYNNGYSSFYCHLQKVTVSQGASVKLGQAVATSDNTGEWTTGAHLHMGIRNSAGSFVDPRKVPGMSYPPLR